MTGSQLTIQFSDSEREVFEENIQEDFHVCMQVLGNVAVEKSEAHSEDDRRRIMEVVKELDGDGDGFHYINVLITGLMRKWLTHTAQELLRRYVGDMSNGEAGTNRENVYKTMNVVGSILSEQGNDDQAVELYRLAYLGYKVKNGEDSENAVSVSQNLASALVGMGDDASLTEAGELYRYGVEVRKKTLGGQDARTLTSKFNLGTWYFEVGDVQQAHGLIEETLKARRQVLGNEHGDTVSSMVTLATILTELGRFDEASPYYEEVLRIKANINFDDDDANLILNTESLDVTSLHTMGEYAILMHSVGNLQRAKIMSEACVKGYEKIYGHRSGTTAEALYNQGVIYDELNMHVEALVSLNKALVVFEATGNNMQIDQCRILKNDLVTKLAKKKWKIGLLKLKAMMGFVLGSRNRAQAQVGSASASFANKTNKVVPSEKMHHPSEMMSGKGNARHFSGKYARKNWNVTKPHSKKIDNDFGGESSLSDLMDHRSLY